MCDHVHRAALFWRHIGKPGLLENPPVEEIHYVEWRPDDRFIMTQAVHFWYRDISRPQCIDDFVLSLDGMGGSRDKLTGGLLPQDELCTCCRSDFIRRIGLPVAKLQCVRGVGIE